MICYLEDVTEEEIAVINDYWKLSDDISTVFQYTLKQIDDKHKPNKVRPVRFLAKKSVFVFPHNLLTCQECDCNIPVINRRDLINRINSEEKITCSDCVDRGLQRILDGANQIVNEYRAEKFAPIAYLNNLAVEELLVLLSITTEYTENNAFLGMSPDDVIITGIQMIDKNIVLSLIDKKALVYIPEVPFNVERASNVIYSLSNITFNNTVQYWPSESVYPGIYVNSLALDRGEEVSDISKILYQKLQSLILSVDDVVKIHQIIKETQIGKLYELVREIAKEYQIEIDNSNILGGLIEHVAGNYSPMKIYYTFRVKAWDTLAYLYKDSVSGYRAKHIFTASVRNYIQYIEDKGFELKKSWTLPQHIRASSFEALFSRLYLDGHFDWNRLSAKAVVALWLENVRLEEGAQELLAKEGQNSTE